MAATTFSLVVTAADGETPTHPLPRVSAQRLYKWFMKRAGRLQQGTDTVKARTAAVAASGTITFGTSVDADDTVTIGGIAFTAKASGATGNQWNIDADAEVCAANFVTAVEASATAGVVGCITLSRAGAVVTVTAAQPGSIGNAITLTSSDGTDLVVSGTRLAGGAETLTTYSY